MANNPDKLIQSLSKDLEPVSPPKPLLVRVIQWLAPAVLCGLIGFMTLGLNEAIFANMHSIQFMAENILLLVAGILLAAAAFMTAIPGYNSKMVLLLLAAGLAIWGGIFALSGGQTSAAEFSAEAANHTGILCTFDVILLTAIPGIIAFALLKKHAATNLGYSGALVVLATASIAAASSRFLCHIMDPAHLIIWHFLPVILMGIFGILLGRWLLKW